MPEAHIDGATWSSWSVRRGARSGISVNRQPSQGVATDALETAPEALRGVARVQQGEHSSLLVADAQGIAVDGRLAGDLQAETTHRDSTLHRKRRRWSGRSGCHDQLEFCGSPPQNDERPDENDGPSLIRNGGGGGSRRRGRRGSPAPRIRRRHRKLRVRKPGHACSRLPMLCPAPKG